MGSGVATLLRPPESRMISQTAAGEINARLKRFLERRNQRVEWGCTIGLLDPPIGKRTGISDDFGNQ